MKARILNVALLLCATCASCRPAMAQETFVFPNAVSDGKLGSPANGIEVASSAGGYLIGRIDLSGRLTSLHPNSWPSDSRIRITSPSGAFVDVQPVEAGGSFVATTFAKTVLFEVGTDPIGDWTFRFYETFDDGIPGQPDASWLLTVDFKVESVPPPPAIDIGVIGFPSSTVVTAPPPLAAAEVVWIRFTLDQPVHANANTFFDIDSEGSFGLPPGGGTPLGIDSVIALYDALGNLLVVDDDSGTHFLSQLTFGAGTRPALLNGLPYNGRNGPLNPGVYYLAAASHPTSFGPQGWDVISSGPEVEQLRITVRAGHEGACYADCDLSTGVGVLDIFDFLCFQNSFVSGNAYACDCDTSTGPLVCDIFDFLCFQNAFVTGCP